MDTLIGKTLGQYQIQVELGRGGMATVYRAFQPSLNRSVAVKVLPVLGGSDPSLVARFRREAAVVAGLQHPNILPVYDFGEQDGILYIVMMLVSGGTLEERLSRPMDAVAALRITNQLAGALDYAHRQGVIHRDVKPSNILMAGPDWPLLSDFGIARILQSDTQLTRTGVGIGTPQYMSPEQGLGRPVDARSDIYSLGIILYQMLTGRVPYQGDTAFAVIHQHVYEPLTLPSLVQPGIPSSVETVVVKALAKQPADRYQTAAAFKQALEEALTLLRAPSRLEAAGLEQSETGFGRTHPATSPTVPAAGMTQVATGKEREDRASQRGEGPTLGPVSAGAGDVAAERAGPEGRLTVWWWAAAALAVAAVLGLAGLLALLGVFDSERAPDSADAAARRSEATATPIAESQAEDIVFEETFISPRRDGWTGDTDKVFTEGGKLRIVYSEKGFLYRTWPTHRPRVNDFAYEAEITRIAGAPGDQYGLFFRYRHDENYYVFLVSGDGRYSFSKRLDGRWRNIVGPAVSPAVAVGDNITNVLKVEAIGTRFKLFVNDQLLAETDDDSSPGGTFGLAVENNSGVEIRVAVSRVKMVLR